MKQKNQSKKERLRSKEKVIKLDQKFKKLQDTFLNDSIIPPLSDTVKYVESDFVDLLENLKERCSSLTEKKIIVP